MKRSSIELYFDVLACVARSDGRVSPEESALVRSAAVASGLAGDSLARVERRLDMREPFSLDDALAEVAPDMDASTVAETLRDAYVLAAADNDIVRAEISVIDRFLAHVGVAEEHRPALHEWARRAAEHHLDGLALLTDAWPSVAPGGSKDAV